ncbi:MAG: enoyl-CoA hydratase [Hyphomonas sp.]|jgi:enoyl-CoA hydratase
MSEPIVLTERHGAVMLVTLNRPDALNALSRALRAEIVRVFTELKDNPEIRAVVLTGNGRAFTAGIDLKEAGQTGFALGADEDSRAINLAAAMEAYPWPIVGAINGFAITGGFELALMCDVLLASEHAKFADTHARVGIVPGWGLSQKLSRLIGISRAKELSFTGNFIDAHTAEKWGLVNRVYPAADLVPAALKLATEMTSTNPDLLRKYKALIDDGFGMTFAAAMKEEVKRSIEHSKSVSASAVEEARKQVTARGRDQQG